MIRLTRLDGTHFHLNAELIQTVEAVPDTHVRLANGQSYVVRDTAEAVAARVIAYQRQVRLGLWTAAAGSSQRADRRRPGSRTGKRQRE